MNYNGVLLPRYIQPEERHNVLWARYVALEHRVFHVSADEKNPPARVMTLTARADELQIDPDSPTHRERQRILVWHSLLGGESETLSNV
ncbi:MAG: hypothetical protein ACK41E_07085 [Deinococcales bacterium]